MVKIVTVSEMRVIELEADAAGLTYAQMMKNAGQGLADVVEEVYGQGGERSIMALVGSGNNGGDALVALERLAGKGWNARAYLVRMRPEADVLVERLSRAGGTILYQEGDTDFENLNALMRSSRVLLDGIYGTGIRLPLSGEASAAARGAMRIVRAYLRRSHSELHVVAVDCPSGVDCDSGAAADETIGAEMTVTMAAVKMGLLRFPAAKLIGALRVVGIGPVEELRAWMGVRRRMIEMEDIQLPPRPLDAHKGTFGTALIVAGSTNYTGAALLAGEAAYRAGAGLVTMAIPAPLHATLAGRLAEATWVLLPHTEGIICKEAVADVRTNLGRATSVLVGPGMGAAAAAKEFVACLVREISNELSGLVFDADGLRHLVMVSEDWSKLIPARTVLTPHAGEMGAMTGLSVEEIQQRRIETAEQAAQSWGHVVVLKGAYTVIADPEGETSVIPVATPALARAGTGDVLAGLIVGLRAQGMDAFEAAKAGAMIHAKAGMLAAERMGSTASVLAGDVLNAIPAVMAKLVR
ncbi:MAG: NAD(P)H-hydrate dehydratase [Anaerolineales bacterium]|nr:NAD(P)H-hydrate dehydratase [Anaerolineales bacterium]